MLLCTALPAFTMQCDCKDPGSRENKRYAEIVFQGTVTSFRDSSDGRVVVFRVSRVWKGHVTATFEMPALESTCGGFYPGLLKIGNELLVFAVRMGSLPGFYPQLCTTSLVRDVKDIRALGSGRKPK